MSAPTHPYAADSATSVEAAESIAPFAQADAEAIFAAIARSLERGMTTDEVEVLLDLKHQTASARVNELERAGRIYRTCRQRKTRSNRWATVYVGTFLLCHNDRKLTTAPQTGERT